jgi:hypothetical protein
MERTKTAVGWVVMDILFRFVTETAGQNSNRHFIKPTNPGGGKPVRIRLGKRHEVFRLAGYKPNESGNEGVIFPPPLVHLNPTSHVTRAFHTEPSQILCLLLLIRK